MQMPKTKKKENNQKTIKSIKKKKNFLWSSKIALR